MPGMILSQAAQTKIVNAHAALAHLIDTWKLDGWDPHDTFGRLTAMRSCLHDAETVISRLEDRAKEASHA